MSLKQDSIDSVQLLHYKTVELEKLLADICLSDTAVRYNKTAEVSIFYGNQHSNDQEDADEMSRTVLECKLLPTVTPYQMADANSDAIHKTKTCCW